MYFFICLKIETSKAEVEIYFFGCLSFFPSHSFFNSFFFKVSVGFSLLGQFDLLKGSCDQVEVTPNSDLIGFGSKQ